MMFYARPLHIFLTKTNPKVLFIWFFKCGSINVIKYQNLTYVKPAILCMRCFELMISAAVKEMV